AVSVGTVVLAVLAVALWLYQQQRNVRWARDNVTRVQELAETENYFEAYDLAVQVAKYLPNDPALGRLLPTIADELSVETEPEGAHVYLKRFAPDQSGRFPQREAIGTTPIHDLKIARGDYVLAIEKEGFAATERTISSRLDRLENGLWKRGTIHE